jgi:hypothetical protein
VKTGPDQARNGEQTSLEAYPRHDFREAVLSR